jgi:hypothetical protein
MVGHVPPQLAELYGLSSKLNTKRRTIPISKGSNLDELSERVHRWGAHEFADTIAAWAVEDKCFDVSVCR